MELRYDSGVLHASGIIPITYHAEIAFRNDNLSGLVRLAQVFIKDSLNLGGPAKIASPNTSDAEGISTSVVQAYHPVITQFGSIGEELRKHLGEGKLYCEGIIIVSLLNVHRAA